MRLKNRKQKKTINFACTYIRRKNKEKKNKETQTIIYSEYKVILRQNLI